MHEMALTRNVVDIVLEQAARTGAAEVTAVYVTIGACRDIIDEIFTDMFAWMARNTVAEHAKVLITRIPVTVRCNRCGNVYPIDFFDQSTWTCACCGVRDYCLNTGTEFYISHIEVRCSGEETTPPSPRVASAHIPAVCD